MISTNINVDRPSQRLSSLSVPAYPDAGLFDRGGVTEADAHASVESNKHIAKPSRKRSSADAGLAADVARDNEDPTFDLRRSTRQSKRIKTSTRCNDTSEEKIRKVSKLEQKIAKGKTP